jgi:hypothetical protein
VRDHHHVLSCIVLSVSFPLNDWLTRGSSRTEANWRWMIWISMGVMPLL